MTETISIPGHIQDYYRLNGLIAEPEEYFYHESGTFALTPVSGEWGKKSRRSRINLTGRK